MDHLWQKHLNPQQLKAVTFSGGPLLVLAGAGSGKTRVLTYRTAYLIKEKKLLPENILLVTFTNKAAEEMRTRIKKLLKTNQFPFTGTFHSFCARVLRQNGACLGIPSSFVIYDEPDQVETIKEAINQLGIDSQRWQPKSILITISQAKNELLSPDEYAPFARGSFQEIVAQVYPRYQKLLTKAQALDFDDLLLKTVQLFAEYSEVLELYQDQFHHILVDEYQDTNKAQYQLTRLLAKKRQNLTVVGDASQSIYSWRGADFRNLVHLSRDFGKITTINLEQNYRSSQTILDAAHSIIKHNQTHPILKLWTKQARGSKIILCETGSQYSEAELIASLIKKDKLKQPLKFSFSDYAVLYRTNAQSRALEEVLIRQGLPYRLVGGVKFYERKEIKDCLAYLRLVNNFQDTISKKRAEKIGKRRFQSFLNWQKKLPEKLPSTKKLLEKILEATKYLERFDKNNQQELGRIENIKELSSVAAEFPLLTEFLENVSLVQQDYLPQGSAKLNHQSPQKTITLMTLHAAKGLEFATVFLVGMEEGLFPHSRSLLSREDLEEERRLCYVGMTRAKTNLYLIYARKRLWFGTYNRNSVSRFVADLPKHLLEFRTNTDHHFRLE